jgi:NADPH:quinone reductase-like Zn-dependent oxidoreductase
MKAFIVNRYGKKEKLALTEIAEPVIKENDVLVQIHSAGVNLLDSKIRNGEFKMLFLIKPPGMMVWYCNEKVQSHQRSWQKFMQGLQTVELEHLPN